MHEQEQASNDYSNSYSYIYPALPPSTGSIVEDEALQGLLMAWYYSGYATGRYQAMKEMGYYNNDGCSTNTNTSTAENDQSGDTTATTA